MKEKILKLRAKGKTYDEIKEALGCSKGTISYHCGDGQKEKYLKRQRRNRKTVEGIIRGKVDSFLRMKVLGFKRKHSGRRRTWQKVKSSNFKYYTAYKKVNNNPICYLTGRKIDLSNPRSYHLDHIIPPNKKGRNILKNMGLTCKDANMAKSELLLSDFIKLCIEVCEYNGYRVVKK